MKPNSTISFPLFFEDLPTKDELIQAKYDRIFESEVVFNDLYRSVIKTLLTALKWLTWGIVYAVYYLTLFTVYAILGAEMFIKRLKANYLKGRSLSPQRHYRRLR